MKTKTYTIEIASTTYRTYEVNAESPQKAQEIALNEMDADYEIGKAWKQNAEVVFCEPQGGTSHMSDEEFGKYISGRSSYITKILDTHLRIFSSESNPNVDNNLGFLVAKNQTGPSSPSLE